jgi:hypothetical protein
MQSRQAAQGILPIVGMSLVVAPLFQANLQQQFQIGARFCFFVCTSI